MDTGHSSELAPHEMRITQGGKIRSWVEFALKFFEENEERALVLHTLPVTAERKSKENRRNEDAADEDEPQSTKEKSGLSASTAAIPRLITVVEIIKREYLASKQSPHLVGLFQYNEMGSLEDQVEKEEEEEESEGDRMKMIAEALAGSKNVQVTKTPYMKVTLCRKEVAGMKESGATTQAALKRTMSRSAKVRAKKRAAREASENEKRE